MISAHRTLAFTTASLLVACTGVAQAEVFNNNGGSGLWSDTANWTGGDIADDNTENAQINPPAVNVDNSFTIKGLNNSFGTALQTISGIGALTIDRNASGPGNGIRNVAGNAGGLMTIDTNIDIANSQGGITWIANNNSAGNVLAFGSSSTLTLTTRAEVVQAVGGSVEFNGELAGGDALRLNHNNVTFGATSNSPSYTGDIVFFNNASVVVDTAASNTFFGGTKLQINGSSSLTLNNEGVLANEPQLAFSGTPTFNLDVNGDQAFGNLVLNNATVNLTLGAGVDDLDFLPSAAFSWGGTLNINNFTSGVIGFGFDGGLDASQLSSITIDGQAPASPLFLDVNGKLVDQIASLLGDLDSDGDLDVDDLNLLGAFIGEGTTPEEGDIDDDGDVDVDDISAWLALIGTVNGDANFDLQVETGDLAILAGSFGSSASSFADGDFNLDGTVDTGDLAILAGTFGTDNTPALSVAAIPEPASLALLGLGGLAALARRRRA